MPADIGYSDFAEDDDPVICANHCDWRGTVSDLAEREDDPEELACPKCGASTSMLIIGDAQ